MNIVSRYESVKEDYPSDGPNREILISFTLVTLLLHGIGAFIVWRRCGGYRFSKQILCPATATNANLEYLMFEIRNV